MVETDGSQTYASLAWLRQVDLKLRVRRAVAELNLEGVTVAETTPADHDVRLKVNARLRNGWSMLVLGIGHLCRTLALVLTVVAIAAALMAAFCQVNARLAGDWWKHEATHFLMTSVLAAGISFHLIGISWLALRSRAHRSSLTKIFLLDWLPFVLLLLHSLGH